MTTSSAEPVARIEADGVIRRSARDNTPISAARRTTEPSHHSHCAYHPTEPDPPIAFKSHELKLAHRDEICRTGVDEYAGEQAVELKVVGLCETVAVHDKTIVLVDAAIARRPSGSGMAEQKTFSGS